MDYKDLQIFLSIAECQNLGRASEAQHMSASSLSRRLAKMEQTLGTQLIARDTQPLQLTFAGEQFRQHAEQTLVSWQGLKTSLHQRVSDISGSLTLFCSVTASYSVVADLLTQFRASYPNIDLRIHTGDAAESIPRVEQGEADVVVAARPERLAKDLSFKPLLNSPLVFIAPRTLESSSLLNQQLHQVEPDWSAIPLVLSESGLARARVNRWFAAKNIKPSVYAQVSGNEAIVSMVALGVGVGIVPEIVLRNSPMANRVRVINVQPQLESFSIGLCANSQRLQEPQLMALWSVVE